MGWSLYTLLLSRLGINNKLCPRSYLTIIYIENVGCICVSVSVYDENMSQKSDYRIWFFLKSRKIKKWRFGHEEVLTKIQIENSFFFFIDNKKFWRPIFSKMCPTIFFFFLISKIWKYFFVVEFFFLQKSKNY